MKSDAPRGGDVFDIDRIRHIVELMEQHELSEVDLQQGDDRIKLTRGKSQVMVAAPSVATGPSPVAAPTAAPTPTAPAEAIGTLLINSPMVGTFYSRANPTAEPFVKVGTRITEDTVVCIIEAMKVFNEIPAECRGTVIEVLASDQQPVDFGKPLFRIQKDG